MARKAPVISSASALSDDQRKLLERLRETRGDYKRELVWHRFLMDAYSGTGGFQGRTRMPFASFWGEAAETYSTLSIALTGIDTLAGEDQIETYLDRYPREDLGKFRRRVNIAQYTNYCEPIADLRLSYLNRKPMTYSGVEALEKGDDPWMANAYNGLSWDRLMRDVMRLRAFVLGWCPMLIDAPKVEGEISVAQAKEQGLGAQAIPLYPSNVLDYLTDERGSFTWVKLVTRYTRRETIFVEPVTVECYSVWTPQEVFKWEVTVDSRGDDVSVDFLGRTQHAFGRVPVIIFRAKPAPNDPVRGLSVVGSVAQLNRRLFNYLSEFDEHLRSSVFSMLQVPTKHESKIGTLVTGSSNAVAVPPDSSREYKWIEPSGVVAETYEKRVEVTVQEIHRIGRSESGAGKTVAKSGVAQAYDFESTNRAISDNASSLAASEQEALRLVLVIESPTDDPSKVRVTAATRFDVEEMAKELEEALTAVDLDLGITATALMKKRLVRKLLPNLNEEELETIDDEIDARTQQLQDEADFARQQLAAGMSGEGEDEEDAVSEDEDAPTPPPPAQKPGQRTKAKKGAPLPARKGKQPPRKQ